MEKRKMTKINLLLIMVILSSCSTFESIDINGEYKEIILEDKRSRIYHLYLKIEGNITGTTQIEWGDGEWFEPTINISKDNKKYIYDTDYYENKIIIKINPEKNCNGKLNIYYKFSSL
jgi:hypothetical protein